MKIIDTYENIVILRQCYFLLFCDKYYISPIYYEDKGYFLIEPDLSASDIKKNFGYLINLINSLKY